MCRPGPVWQSPPRTGIVRRIWDSFDHGGEGESGGERASLLGEGIEGVDIGEEEEEFQDRSCSESNEMSAISSSEPVLQSDATSLLSPSVEGSAVGQASLAGEHSMRTDE